MGKKGRDFSDRAGFTLDIVEREIALGRRVEFEDLGNAETGLESLPDVTAQAVAASQPEPMPALEFRCRRFQEIAAEFADILEQRTIPADDVAPEPVG